MMRARLLFAVLPLLLSIGLDAQAPATTSTPAPEAFFGFRMGADGQLADWESLQKYFVDTAAASDRVEIVDAGPSTEGRRMIAALVTSPENVARLEEIRLNSRRLADPRTLDEKAAL